MEHKANQPERAESNQPLEANTEAHFLRIQRGLMTTFAGVITLWYFTSPYLVHPHPKFG